MKIPELGKPARSSVMRYGVFLLLLGGCLFTPPAIFYNSYLVPHSVHSSADRYIVEEDGVVTYSTLIRRPGSE